jgi:ABC-type multidrug transport system ATPase subunit
MALKNLGYLVENDNLSKYYLVKELLEFMVYLE